MTQFKIGDRVRSNADDASNGHVGVLFTLCDRSDWYVDFGGDNFEGTYRTKRYDAVTCDATWLISADDLILIRAVVPADPVVTPLPTPPVDIELEALASCVSALETLGQLANGAEHRVLDYLYQRYVEED